MNKVASDNPKTKAIYVGADRVFSPVAPKYGFTRGNSNGNHGGFS